MDGRNITFGSLIVRLTALKEGMMSMRKRHPGEMGKKPIS